MDVCAAIRARFRRAGAPKRLKVGHAGTLDPLATGLLVVMVGRATSLCTQLMASEKVYETTIDLSAFSNTDDAEGERSPVNVPSPPSLAEISVVLNSFVGLIQQRPPAFSAMKVAGQRAYQLARRGETVQLALRPVLIHSITLESYQWPLLCVVVTCGKGTYIRSLARDIGTALGTGGMLASLRRTRSGAYTVSQATPLQLLPDVLTTEHLLAVPASQPLT